LARSRFPAETAFDLLDSLGFPWILSCESPGSLEGVEAAFDHYAEAIGSEGLTQGLPVDALERIFTLGFALDQMRQDFRDLDRCASEIARRQ
jgi:hypothetical protein